MSYILDALKRADSEREHGVVPGVHAQPMLLDTPNTRSTLRIKTWSIAVVTLVASLVAALIWSILRHQAQTTAPQPVSLATAPVQRAATEPVPSAARSEVEPSSTSPAPPDREVPAVSLPPPRVPTTRTQITPNASRRTAALRREVTSRPLPPKEAKPVERTFSIKELPREIQQELPKLLIGGSIHSKSAANRILIVNGQLLHEGDQAAPGVTIQHIKLKAAVLKYKSYSYEIAY